MLIFLSIFKDSFSKGIYTAGSIILTNSSKHNVLSKSESNSFTTFSAFCSFNYIESVYFLKKSIKFWDETL